MESFFFRLFWNACTVLPFYPLIIPPRARHQQPECAVQPSQGVRGGRETLQQADPQGAGASAGRARPAGRLLYVNVTNNLYLIPFSFLKIVLFQKGSQIVQQYYKSEFWQICFEKELKRTIFKNRKGDEVHLVLCFVCYVNVMVFLFLNFVIRKILIPSSNFAAFVLTF